MDLLNQKVQNTFGNQKPRGLLNSRFGQDLGLGLLSQSGYTTMPTSFGQTVGNAYQNALDADRKRQMLNLAEIGAIANVAKAVKPKSKTDFFNKLDLFNQISAKPEDQRTQSENNTLAALENTLMDKETIGDLKVSLAKKIKNGEELTEGEIALKEFLKATDPLAALLGSFQDDAKVDEPKSDSEYKKITNINDASIDDFEEGAKYEINGIKYTFTNGGFKED
tara:strand:+ start:40 stop:708 length:669 start_codon:yes stop_codon:yes gene_type:complete